MAELDYDYIAQLVVQAQKGSSDAFAELYAATYRRQYQFACRYVKDIFLAQDIFGGKVYGVLRPGGNYHCYNVIGDCRFDLTSEQFGDEHLVYENNPEQFREVHFAKEEKRLRYEYLKRELEKWCSK